MCLFKLTSYNPDFSFVISKNPETGMVMREIRKGTAFGFFPKNSDGMKYIVHFRDHPSDPSYKEFVGQKGEYVNFLKYSSPLFVLNAIQDFFSSAMRTKHAKDDESFGCKFTNYAVYMSKQTFKMINKLIPFLPLISKYTAKPLEECVNLYKISILCGSTYELLNMTFMLFSLIAILNNDDVDFNDNMVLKIASAANVVKAPYYVRYVVASRMIKSPASFDKIKPLLELEGTKMFRGSTHVQRQNVIKTLFDFEYSIIDIGCGEGCYAVPFATKIEPKKLQYYACDSDLSELKKLQKKIESNKLSNVICTDSHLKIKDLLTTNGPFDVLMTEVIEHNNIADAKEIITWAFDNLPFHKIVITVPNKEFNNNYNFGDEQMRHCDHVWEPTEAEFRSLIEGLVADRKFKLNFIKIGDQVGECSVSVGCVIDRLD